MLLSRSRVDRIHSVTPIGLLAFKVADLTFRFEPVPHECQRPVRRSTAPTSALSGLMMRILAFGDRRSLDARPPNQYSCLPIQSNITSLFTSSTSPRVGVRNSMRTPSVLATHTPMPS